MDPEIIRTRIASQLAGARAEVRDTTGTGDHFEAFVVADAFEGRSLVERHQLVYGLFREELASERIHALALKTLAPSEKGAEQVTGGRQ